MEPQDLKERIEQNLHRTLGYVEGKKVIKLMTKGKSSPKTLKDKTIVFETSYYETEKGPAYQVYAKAQNGEEVGLLEYRFVKDDEVSVFRLKVLDENYKSCGIRTNLVKCFESVAKRAKIKTISGNFAEMDTDNFNCEKIFEKLKYLTYTDGISKQKCFYKDFVYDISKTNAENEIN